MKFWIFFVLLFVWSVNAEVDEFDNDAEVIDENAIVDHQKLTEDLKLDPHYKHQHPHHHNTHHSSNDLEGCREFSRNYW